jgi:branched-chain amino acid transport system substrate-binding protein
MNKTTKTILGVILVIIVAFLVWYGVSKKPQVSVSKETIRIGVILPLTGNSAFMGQSAQKAVLLAKDQMLKDTKYNYELIFEDDKKDPTTAVNALNKLINIDKVDAIISFGSAQGNVISPITQQNKIIHFCVASDPNVAKGDFNFIHWTPPEAEANKFVEEIQQRNLKNIALIGVQDPGFIETWNVLKEKLQKAGVAITNEEWFTPGAKDFRTMLLKIKKSNPDIIYIGAWSPELELLAQQIKELNISIPLTTVEAFEFTNQQSLFEGYWYIQGSEPTEKFSSDYFEKYNEQVQVGAANVFDIFNLIVEGFEKAGGNINNKPTPESVVQELLKIKDFPGAVGNLTVKENHIVWSDAVVKMIQNGKPVIIRR